MPLELSQRTELEWLAKIVADIRLAAPKLKPLLIGAFARDLLLHFHHGQPAGRATQDVDFAVAVADWNAFRVVRDALIASGRFEPDSHVLHKLRHTTYGWMDLVPFGAIERPDGTIAWPPSGDDEMEVVGCAEADANAIAVVLPNFEQARVVSLPMLAVLKVFAWNDRNHSTGKDGVDLGLILRSYLEAGNIERLAEEFPQVLKSDFDFDAASGWLLGRDARQAILTHSKRVDVIVGRLDAILDRELMPDRSSALLLQVKPGNADTAVKMLTAFQRGLSGAPGP